MRFGTAVTRGSQVAAMSCLVALVGACSSSNKTPASSSSSSSSSSTSSSSSSSGDIANSPCSDSEALVCGDFDTWASDGEFTLPAGWSINNSEGSEVTVSSEQAYSGAQSIKVVSAGGGYNRGFLTMDLSEAAPLQHEMFGRIMVYVTDENANAGDFTFLQAEGSTPQAESGAPDGTMITYRGRIDQAYDHVFTNYDTWIDENADNVSDWPTDCYKQPAFTETTPPAEAYILPKNEWSCIQWHMAQDSDHIDFSLNGTSLNAIRIYGDNGHGCADDTTQDGIWYAPQEFERVHVGIEQYAEDALPRTMYIDDVKVHTELVECDGTFTDPSQH